MILVEKRLKELFATLPPIVRESTEGESIEFKPAFDFGDQEDLLWYLAQKKKLGGKVYPLIWLETPITKKGKENRVTVDLKLVLATLNQKTTMSNLERLNRTFTQTLVPLYENVLKALEQSGFTEILKPENNKRTDFYNYGVKQRGGKDSEHKTTDIWDVIKLECELELTDCKQQNINY